MVGSSVRRTGTAHRNQPAPGRDALPSLLPDLAALAVSKLTHAALRAFAATSTASLHFALDSRADLTEFRVDQGLERAIPRFGNGNKARQRSNVLVHCRLTSANKPRWFQVLVPLKAAAAICAHLCSCRATARAAIRVLPHALLRRITRLQCHRTAGQLVIAVPERLTALREVSFSGCKLQQPAWLPTSSSTALRTLSVAGTKLGRLPGGLVLDTIDVSRCQGLQSDWLPASSAAVVRILNMAHTCVHRLPEGMRGLANIDVTGCAWSTHWLHADSLGSVRMLRMAACALRSVPGGLSALEHLTTSFLDHEVDWLPCSSTPQLQTLAVHCLTLARLTRGSAGTALDRHLVVQLACWQLAACSVRGQRAQTGGERYALEVLSQVTEAAGGTDSTAVPHAPSQLASREQHPARPRPEPLLHCKHSWRPLRA